MAHALAPQGFKVSRKGRRFTTGSRRGTPHVLRNVAVKSPSFKVRISPHIAASRPGIGHSNHIGNNISLRIAPKIRKRSLPSIASPGYKVNRKLTRITPRI